MCMCNRTTCRPSSYVQKCRGALRNGAAAYLFWKPVSSTCRPSLPLSSEPSSKLHSYPFSGSENASCSACIANLKVPNGMNTKHDLYTRTGYPKMLIFHMTYI